MSPDGERSRRARRVLLVVATLGLLLTIALALGWKGLLCELGDMRLSVRAPRNPAMVLIAATIAAWSLAPAGRRWRTLADDSRAFWALIDTAVRGSESRFATRAATIARVLAAAISVAVVVVAWREGAPIAGGSDSYGYVSQAHLWATGKLRVEPPLLAELAPVLGPRSLAPLGYLLARDAPVLVPTYSSGLPMVMAVFELVGGRRAVFWVVPLLGGVAVWASYLLGARAAGPLCGLLAAALVASSPAFLFQLTAAPMSDLPAAAWWTLSLVLLFTKGRAATLLAGVVSGIAILTRPNLVPLALVPGIYLAWETLRDWKLRRSSAPRPHTGESGAGRRASLWRLIGYVCGVVPACLMVAAINNHLHGSPLQSGYDVERLFALEHALPNLARYPVLATEMHTPLIWVGMLAPVLLSFRSLRTVSSSSGRRVVGVAIGIVIAVFGCYLFYPAFDAYWRLRFLLPGIPALLVATSAGLVALAGRWSSRWALAAVVVVVALAAWHGIAYARARAAFATEGEWRYAIIGDYIARELPERAVLFAMQHSGSVRYYSGRAMVRYDQIPKRKLNRVVARLQELGRPSYFVLDGWEEEEFRQRFRFRSPFARLDWPPKADLEFGDVRIYDAADRDRWIAGEKTATEVIPWPFLLP